MSTQRRNKNVKKEVKQAIKRRQITATPKQPKKQKARRDPHAKSGPHTRRLAESVVDPFNVSACIPDGARGTGCLTIKQTGTLTTTATGTCVGIFLGPDPGAMLYPTMPAGTVPTVGGNWTGANNASSATASYAAYRVVSMGLRLTYIGPTTSDQGVLMGFQIPEDWPISNFNGVALSTATQNVQYYKTVPARNGICVTWRPVDMDGSSEFRTYATAAKAVSDPYNLPVLGVVGYGLAVNTGLFQYETIVNLESQFKLQDFMPGGISNPGQPKTAEPGWYEIMQNLVSGYEAIKPVVVGLYSMANGFRYRSTIGSGGRRI